MIVSSSWLASAMPRYAAQMSDPCGPPPQNKQSFCQYDFESGAAMTDCTRDSIKVLPILACDTEARMLEVPRDWHS